MPGGSAVVSVAAVPGMHWHWSQGRVPPDENLPGMHASHSPFDVAVPAVASWPGSHVTAV